MFVINVVFIIFMILLSLIFYMLHLKLCLKELNLRKRIILLEKELLKKSKKNKL
jgi:uncharacterized membrane protein YciS (DUF1049 family)